jgi:predicted transcriptional regulator
MHCDNLDSEELDKAYREITKEAGVSPNTIKAVLNRAGLDESTTIHSRAFELFSEGKTPLQVVITLNLETEKAIQYHQQYLMLLGCTDVYISKGFILS